MRINQIKKKLQDGQPAFGVSVMIPSPQVVEMIGLLGFDWVLIDCEHGSISLESVELMAMAAESSGITAIARPTTNRPEAILQVLDRGVMGVQVPHVNTVADAKAAVEAARYYPEGRRGLAAGTRPANYGFGLKMDEYVDRANRELLVCVQIEEEEALANLDELIQVDGVDVFFVGPSDLSQSFKQPGRTDVPQLQEAMDRVFASVSRAGKISGCAGNLQKTQTYLNQGVRYLYTHFTTLLSNASEEFLGSLETNRKNRDTKR